MLLQEVCAQKRLSKSAVMIVSAMKIFTAPSAVCSKKRSGVSYATRIKPCSTVKCAGRETIKDTRERSSSIL